MRSGADRAVWTPAGLPSAEGWAEAGELASKLSRSSGLSSREPLLTTWCLTPRPLNPQSNWSKNKRKPQKQSLSQTSPTTVGGHHTRPRMAGGGGHCRYLGGCLPPPQPGVRRELPTQLGLAPCSFLRRRSTPSLLTFHTCQPKPSASPPPNLPGPQLSSASGATIRPSVQTRSF